MLSDTVIIARARAAILDLRTAIANSLKLISESKHVLTLIIGPSIKIDNG